MASLPDVIYHYTSLSAFQNIIDGIKEGNHFLTFWASDVRTMNDPTEMKYGLEQAKKFIENWEKKNNVEESERLSRFSDVFPVDKYDYPDMYAISCSADANNPYLWDTYGDRQRGVNIHIQDDGVEFPLKSFVNFVDVIYGEIKECSIIGDEIIWHYDAYLRGLHSKEKNAGDIGHSMKSCLKDILLIGVNGVKSNIYSKENETRIVAFTSKANGTRIRDGETIPYVEVPIPFEWIKGFTLGPLFDMSKKLVLEKELMRVGFDLEKTPVEVANVSHPTL